MDETPTLRLLSEIEHKLDRLDEDVRDIKERVTSARGSAGHIHRRSIGT